MHIIKDKTYTEQEKKKIKFASYNSNNVLSIVAEDGTHYNFYGDELKMIVRFIKEQLK